MKHFLKETDFSNSEITEIFSLAQNFKQKRNRHTPPTLAGQSWALLFYKRSTRTRVSFEVGISELGGNVITLERDRLQLSRNESMADTAKVLSRYLHGLIIRANDHEVVETFAREGTIPVINALTDFLHPCQIYSDVFSMAEKWNENSSLLESVKGKKIAFLGDCSDNMANSWILAGKLFDLEISFAGPKAFAPGKKIDQLIKENGYTNAYTFTEDPEEAVKNADMIYTDVWVSMGKEDEADLRKKEMLPYQVTMDLLKNAKPESLFMHCLPAHAGEEVTQEVLDSTNSIIFDQAENRLHVQKAILSVISEACRSN